ncbi:LysR family transcriptional regulator [Rhodovibrionaceae bacterium A322]
MLQICAMNWSNLRTFLAVAEAGSLRQAARQLGVSQPTVSRHLQDLETDLGLPLFERRRDGHQLTPAGAELLPAAHAMNRAAQRLEKTARQLSSNLGETLCIEAGETAAAVLTRGLALLQGGPKIELLISAPGSGHQSPAASKVPDLILQHGLPKDGTATTRKVGEVESALYGGERFAPPDARPRSEEEISKLPWLGFAEAQDHYITMDWLRTHMKQPDPAARLMSCDLMMAAARENVGVAVLPCFMGDADASLVRLSAPIEALRAEYWVLVPAELSANPSVRIVITWMTTCFKRLPPL